MKIDIIAGTRPNFVKIAALINILDTHKKITYRLIHTGQHYDDKMSANFFRDLNIPDPHINLNVGSMDNVTQTAEIMIRYQKVIDLKTNICLVVGDVNSTLACAITAKKNDIKVAHVEAGIRSFDNEMPEETNRILTDSITDYFFTTSKKANQNLINQGIAKDKIFFVGNTMIDTLKNNINRLRKPSIWDQEKLIKNDYFLLTLHRPSNVDEDLKLIELLEIISESSESTKIIFPVHPRTKKMLKQTKKFSNIVYVEPLPYLEFNYLLKNSKGVITDSGGITEEATVLNIPCITHRDSTERPETVNIGTNELTMLNLSKLSCLIKKINQKKWKKGKIPEMWDGKTSKRTIAHLEAVFKKEKNYDI